MSHNTNKNAYKRAVLKDRNLDLTKRWYIEFYVWSDDEQKLVRKTYYLSSKFKTVEERQQAALERITAINMALEAGAVARSAKSRNGDVTPKSKRVSLSAMFEKVMEARYAQLRKKSAGSYQSVANNFMNYWEKREIPIKDIKTLKTTDMLEYLNDRQIKDGIENPTLNKELVYLKAMFKDAIEMGMLTENPCVGITKLREDQKRNRIFTEDEIDILRPALKEKHLDLFLYSQIIYYCFIRVKELRLLRISHLNYKESTFFVPAEISKNGRAGYTKIPPKLLELIDEYGIKNYPPSYFIFGNKGEPSETGYSPNTMTTRHNKIAKSLHISGSLYDWKHTGIFQSYLQGIRMKDISLQCRHSSLDETDRYFEKQGFYMLTRTFEFE